MQASIKECILDASRPAKDILGAVWDALTEDRRDHVLTLRGMLAFNVLQHCLQKRHQVDFGVNR